MVVKARFRGLLAARRALALQGTHDFDWVLASRPALALHGYVLEILIGISLRLRAPGIFLVKKKRWREQRQH